MPGFDRSGPGGRGPMTGRGQGYCETPASSEKTRFGRLGGFGRGWRNRYFENEIKNIRKEIARIEKEKEDKGD